MKFKRSPRRKLKFYFKSNVVLKRPTFAKHNYIRVKSEDESEIVKDLKDHGFQFIEDEDDKYAKKTVNLSIVPKIEKNGYLYLPVENHTLPERDHDPIYDEYFKIIKSPRSKPINIPRKSKKSSFF